MNKILITGRARNGKVIILIDINQFEIKEQK